MSKIEWTEKTWNPIVGCTVVSPGCTNCYAMKMAARIERMGGAPQYDGTTQETKGGAVWTGKMALSEKALLEPLKRKKPTTYFVNSMGDLFHEGASDEWIDRVFKVMRDCPQHTFQILTKRSNRMRQYLGEFKQYVHPASRVLAGEFSWNKTEASGPPEADYVTRGGVSPNDRPKGSPLFHNNEWPLPNVWLGVSAEDQQRADERIPDLLDTPAAKRFVSAEPLLGPIDLSDVCNGHYFQSFLTGDRWHDGLGVNSYQRGNPSLDWVIVGGESGHKARPMHPDWARSIRDQCASADVPFFFKQWGEWKSVLDRDKDDPDWRSDFGMMKRQGCKVLNFAGGQGFHGYRVQMMRKIGKKAAGRALDGVTHDGVPA